MLIRSPRSRLRASLLFVNSPSGPDSGQVGGVRQSQRYTSHNAFPNKPWESSLKLTLKLPAKNNDMATPPKHNILGFRDRVIEPNIIYAVIGLTRSASGSQSASQLATAM